MGIELLIGLTLVLLFAMLIGKRLRRREKKHEKKRERGVVDAWIEEALARELAQKIPFNNDAVLEALRGTPEPEPVGAIENAVRSVKVSYARLPQGDEYEVRAEIAFEDGSFATGSRRFKSSELTPTIREEFARTGGSYVFRAWHFPWNSHEQGWI